MFEAQNVAERKQSCGEDREWGRGGSPRLGTLSKQARSGQFGGHGNVIETILLPSLDQQFPK